MLLVLLLCCTACMVLSHFFALFRLTETSGNATTTKYVVNYWYVQSTATSGADGDAAKARVYTRDLACMPARRVYVASYALAIAAAALGALAAVFTLFWMLPCCRCAMGAFVFVLTLLAAACCGGVYALVTYAYYTDFCVGDLAMHVAAPHRLDYSVVESYILVCCAGLGFVLLAFVEAVAYCCVSCCVCCAAHERAASPTEPTHEAKEEPCHTTSDSRDECDRRPYAH